jgi:urease accessory protein
MASSASAFFSEVVAPGRAHLGESFKYQELRSDLDVWRDGKLLTRERQLVRPRDGLLAMQLGGYSHFGSAYVLDSKSRAAGIEEAGLEDHVVVSSSELTSGGRCIRSLGYRAFDLELAFERIAARLLDSHRVPPVCDRTGHARSVAIPQA